MKYLKLYEDHNFFYKEIDIDEFRKMPNTQPIDDTSINNFFRLFNDDTSINNFFRLFNDNNIIDFEFGQSRSDMYVYFNTGEYGVDVYLLDDEWYKVSLLKLRNQKYYLCDQWEGFMKLLKDINVLDTK